MLRWLVIGIGDIARRRVLPAILAEPRGRLAGIVTRDPRKAEVSSACSGKGSLALSGRVVSAFRRARSAATSSRNSGISAQCSQHSDPGISADTLQYCPDRREIGRAHV